MEEIASQAQSNSLTKIRARLSHTLVSGLIFLVRVYQLILSPLLGLRCRYYPSCSEYTRQAIARHGARSGCWLARKRIGRCHPGRAGGVDEVPAVLDPQPCQNKRD